MNKKISLGLGVLVLTLMLTFGVSAVMAADDSSNVDSFVGKCGQTIQKGYGVTSDVIADLLGMSQKEIQAERENGKSIAKIAQEKYVNKEMLVDSMLEAKQQRFQEAVASGYLAQEQADEKIDWMKEKIERKVENSGRGFGHGGCGGGCHR